MAAFNCIQKLKKENKWQMRARFPILLSVSSGFQERAVLGDFCCMEPPPCSSCRAEPPAASLARAGITRAPSPNCCLCAGCMHLNVAFPPVPGGIFSAIPGFLLAT